MAAVTTRAIGTGTIAFGLVSIPVKLFSPYDSAEDLRFHYLHGPCGTRVKQRYHCPACNQPTEREDLVRGYEFVKGKYVAFTAEELKAVEEQSTGDIDIEEFVPLADVDAIYFDRAYYLGPDRGAGRAYRLLAEAMRKTGLAAVATQAVRGKEHLVLLRPVGGRIVLQQLFHSREIRALSEVAIDDGRVEDGELDLAVKLVEQVSTKEFRPEKYKDELRGRIEALIQRKVEGEDITSAAKESPRAQVIDLMAALKASLEPAEAAPVGTPARRGPRRSSGRAAGPQKRRTRTTT